MQNQDVVCICSGYICTVRWCKDAEETTQCLAPCCEKPTFCLKSQGGENGRSKNFGAIPPCLGFCSFRSPERFRFMGCWTKSPLLTPYVWKFGFEKVIQLDLWFWKVSLKLSWRRQHVWNCCSSKAGRFRRMVWYSNLELCTTCLRIGSQNSWLQSVNDSGIVRDRSIKKQKFWFKCCGPENTRAPTKRFRLEVDLEACQLVCPCGDRTASQTTVSNLHAWKHFSPKTRMLGSDSGSDILKKQC